jgi:transposase
MIGPRGETVMKLYGAIDLHSNNSVLVLIDRQDKVRVQRRLANDALWIPEALRPYRSQIEGLAVESTFNGYWLVDALQEAG